MKELKFADIGEGITEGHLLKWLVKDGDEVKEDQPIVQIETDKAVVNLPAPASGKIKIGVKDDTQIKVGDILATIGSGSEAAPTAPSQQAGATPKEKPSVAAQKEVSAPVAAQSAAPKGTKEILAAPSVRKLAKSLNIDLASVLGSGPHGRILQSDIKSASEGAAPAANLAPTASPVPVKPSTTPATTEFKPSPKPTFSQELEAKHTETIERIPMSQTRKAIAKNMELSWTIPRAAHMDLINATDLFKIRTREKERMLKDFGVKLSFLPFIIKATIQAIKENPNFNASYDHEKQEIIRKNYYNIGLAAEAPDGLKVAVIKEADKKSILQIAKEIQELHDKVVNQTITIDEMRDSTFTITNIGSLGGGFLSVPMINYPDVAILGIHMIRDMPIIENGEVKPAKILPFSLVFDHRVVDGAEAVRFGNALIKYLQDPDYLEMLS